MKVEKLFSNTDQVWIRYAPLKRGWWVGCKWTMTTSQKQQVVCTRCLHIQFGYFLWGLPREEYSTNSGRSHPQPEIQWIIIYTLSPISLCSSICGQADLYTVTAITVANSSSVLVVIHVYIKIYLRALSNGGRHPMAQYPTIETSGSFDPIFGDGRLNRYVESEFTNRFSYEKPCLGRHSVGPVRQYRRCR